MHHRGHGAFTFSVKFIMVWWFYVSRYSLLLFSSVADIDRREWLETWEESNKILLYIIYNQREPADRLGLNSKNVNWQCFRKIFAWEAAEAALFVNPVSRFSLLMFFLLCILGNLEFLYEKYLSYKNILKLSCFCNLIIKCPWTFYPIYNLIVLHTPISTCSC